MSNLVIYAFRSVNLISNMVIGLCFQVSQSDLKYRILYI